MRMLLTGLAALTLSLPAQAALPVGAKAPDFTTTGAVGGKPFRIELKDQLKNGPVVLISSPRRSRPAAPPRRMRSARLSAISRRPARE